MEFQSRPFDVETTFAEVTSMKRKRTRKFRGPDSPLYASICPMIYIIKLFGLGPYEFSRDRMVPSNVLLIFSVIILGFYGYTMYTVAMRFSGLKRDRPVLGSTEVAKVACNFWVATYDVLHVVFTRSTFVRIWNAVQDHDETIRQLGYERKEVKTALVAWLIFVLQAGIWVTVNQAGMYAFMEKWVYNVSYMLPYVGCCVSLYKFVGITLILGQRFGQLNEIATQNLPAKSGLRFCNGVSKKTVQDLHNVLLIAAESLGSLYSWSLFFWLGNLSLHSVSNLYFVIDWVLLTPWEEVAWPLICCLSAWLASFILQLLILHIACDYTCAQANSLGAVLISWNVRLIRKHPRTEIIETSLHLISRKLSFSAAGCFDVNLSLLCSIAGLLTTYLVILLQLPD